MSDRAWMLIQMGRLELAEKEIQRALAEDPDDAELIFCLGVISFQQDRFVKAESLLRQVISKEPDFDAAYAQLARVLSYKNNYKDAFEAIDEAIELDPFEAIYFGVKSGLYLAKSDYKNSLKFAEQGLELDPENEECRTHRSIALKHLGRLKEADAVSQSLLEDDPEDVENHVTRGFILLEKNSPQAEQHFLEALRLEPNCEAARIGLAQSLKFKNPFMGTFLRAVVWLERFSIWYLILGAFLLARVSDWLADSNVAIIKLVGTSMNWLWPLLFGMAFLAQPIFDLYLWASKRGVFVLSERLNRNIKWIIFPLLGAVFYLVIFNVDRIITGVYLAFCLTCVAVFLYESFQVEIDWVRNRMYGLLVAAMVLIVCLVVVDFMKVRPLVMKSQRYQFQEFVAPLLDIVDRKSKEDSSVKESNDGSTESKFEEELDQLSEKFEQNKKDIYNQQAMIYIRWLFIPVTLSLLLACTFSEDIVEYLERYAPDAT